MSEDLEPLTLASLDARLKNLELIIAPFLQNAERLTAAMQQNTANTELLLKRMGRTVDEIFAHSGLSQPKPPTKIN